MHTKTHKTDMYVCLEKHVYIYRYIYTYTCVRIHQNTHPAITCQHVHVQTVFTYMHTYKNTSLPIHTYLHTYIHIYIHTLTYIHACTPVVASRTASASIIEKTLDRTLQSDPSWCSHILHIYIYIYILSKAALPLHPLKGLRVHFRVRRKTP